MSRNPYFSKLPTSSKSKPTQSQSPLHKKQYYKFFNENSNRQAEQTFHGQRVAEPVVVEPPREKKEDFKKEIERRFLKSTVNLSFRFRRQANDDENSESLSESSIDSLERLANSIKYDLHSQNLRSYTKSQAALTFEDRKKATLEKSNKTTQQLKGITSNQENNDNLDQYKPYSTYDNRNADKVYVPNAKSNVETSSVFQNKTTEKTKADTHYDHSSTTSRETPMTNDTAFSTLNKATSNGFLNYPQFAMNQATINSNTVHHFSPTYNARTTSSKNRVISDLRQPTPKETKLNNVSASTRNISTTRQPTAGSRATQMSFFPTKNLTSTSSASTRIAFKKTAAAGFRPSNNTELNNLSSEKSLGARMNETEKFFNVKSVGENISKKMFTTYDTDQDASTRGFSRDQLRNTSNLYQKMQNDLLKKLKAGDSGLGVINETSGTYQSSLTTKATTRPTENVFSKAISAKLMLSPRTQNYINGGTNYTDNKKSLEVRGIKQEMSRPMTMSSHLDLSGQHTSVNGYSNIQKLVERTSSPYTNLRSPSARQGESRIVTDRIKYGFK